jgi:DNA-binding transcriptional regulator YiaG
MLELTFAEQLIAWRALRALSQPAAAFELGIHTASLNAVERGRRERLPAVARIPDDLPRAVDRGDLVLGIVRRRLGLRQGLFAERMGVHVYRVRCWESGKPGTLPPPEVVARAVELLRAPYKGS